MMKKISENAPNLKPSVGRRIGIKLGMINPTPIEERKPISMVQVWLTVFYCLAYVISSVTVIRLIPGPFGLMMSGSTFIYPLVYVISDIFSEVYGYHWSRFSNILSFLCNFFVVTMTLIIIYMPLPEDGLVDGEAFKVVFGITPRIFVGSAIAYLIGDWIDDLIFKKMKAKYIESTTGYKLRAIVSDFFSSAIDIIVFYSIALTGVLPISVLVRIVITDMITKFVLTSCVIVHISAPFVKWVHKVENRK